MKKLIAGLAFGLTALFALPEGKYFCASVSLLYPNGLEYKIPDDKVETVTFTYKNRTIIDGKGVEYKYIVTKDDVDYYSNDKSDYIIGLSEDLNPKTKIVGMAIVNKNVTILNACKYLGK